MLFRQSKKINKLRQEFERLVGKRDYISPTQFPYGHHQDYIRRNDTFVTRVDVAAEMALVNATYGHKVSEVITMVPAILYLHQWHTSDFVVTMANSAQLSLWHVKLMDEFKRVIPNERTRLVLCGDYGFDQFQSYVRHIDILEQ